MKHRLSHNQRFLQKLAMTPQMKQSIRLLGMSTRDLNEYVDSALEKNPFLKKEFDKKDSEKYRRSPSSGAKETLPDDYLASMRQEEDPRLNLISQVRMTGLKDKGLEIAEYLIYEMDDNGYITVDMEDVSSALSADIAEVEKALKVIRGLEPAGIGARDVQECLKLQLDRTGKGHSLEYTIISEFSNELARNEVDKIAKTVKKDAEAVRGAINNIKKLNPRPGSSLLSEKTKNVIPDLVAEVSDKGVSLGINRAWLPHLKFYNPYQNEPDIAGDPQAKQFIKENMDAAKGLIDDLNRREETLHKVANYILRFQQESFNEDKHDIKSLSIKDIAGTLNLHPSTISRTVSHKYIQINDEVIALKTLLSRGMKKTCGAITSQAAIKRKIKDWIKNEDGLKPIKDDAILSYHYLSFSLYLFYLREDSK